MGHSQDPAGTPPITAPNPRPQSLPTLAVRLDGTMPIVAMTFPEIPDGAAEAWCYESDFDYLGARALGGGRLELRHRERKRPQVVLVTTLTPEPGAVEVLVRAERDRSQAPDAYLPSDLPFTNLCFQLRRAPAFASAPDPYPQFVARCFLFTEKGRTFLDRTARKKIPVRPDNDPYNDPPWVQMYLGTWQEAPTQTAGMWADYSPDRYSTTLIGTVSRDGRHLVALGNDSASVMAQAWHDCLHNNAQWEPASAPPEKRRWRIKVYVQRNDPAALLRRFARDFPRARRHAGPAEAR